MKHSRVTSRQAYLRAAIAIAAAATTWSASAAIVDNFSMSISTSETAISPVLTAYDLPLTPAGTGVGYYPSGNEYGAVVSSIAPSNPLATVLRNLSLDYFSNYGLAGGLTYRIYANDGPLVDGQPSPSTLLDQKSVTIQSGGITHLSVDYDFAAGNVLPASFTVTVQFAQFGVSGRSAGWMISHANPSTGTNPTYFWEDVDPSAGVDWQAKTFAVPEPNSTVIAGAVLGLAAIAFRMRRTSR